MSENEIRPIDASVLPDIVLMGGLGKLGKPFERHILLTTFDIKGVNYVHRIHSLVRKLNLGDILKLVREPHNEYDPNAVRIDTPAGKKLGYVPRIKADIIAALMDAGKRIVAVVVDTEVYKEDENYYPVKVTVELYLDE